MRNLVRGLLAISALAGAVSLHAQTADEIVSKYIEAIGGKNAISQVKSVYMETSVAMMGNESPSTTVIVDGVGYKTETDVNGTKIIQCYSGKGGWTVNPMAGAPNPTPMPEEQYNAGKGQMYVGGALYDYAAKGSKVEFYGKEGNAYRIKLTSKENVESIFLVDSTSYLITSVQTKGKMQDQDIDITTRYSDWRKTDGGYLMPYTIDMDFGQFGLNIAVKKVELNKTIDPAVFEMPK
jgi:hypothetical protein